MKKFGKREKEILKLVGIGLLASASLAIPNLPIALAPFISSKSRRGNTKKVINKLVEKDLIYLSGDKVKLTKAGKKLLDRIDAQEIKINIPEKWDNIWHIVAYDIPDNYKKERDFFRKKLLELGFVKVQESMFALPFHCKEEIAVFANSLRLSPFVLYLNTDHIPNDIKLAKQFGLN